MGKLNLGSLPPKQEEEVKQQKPSFSLGADKMKAAEAVKRQSSLEEILTPEYNENKQDSQRDLNKKTPGVSFGVTPSLQLGAMKIEEGDGGNNSNRPKLGFGLDLTKAKIIQQDHLNKAQDAKNHAR